MATFTMTVRFFAAAREKAGKSSYTVTVEDGSTVEQVVAQVLRDFPALKPLMPQLRVALGDEFAEGADVVSAKQELAFIPPVAGGAPQRFVVTDRPLSLDSVVALVTSSGHGGVVTFTGAVRDVTHGRPVIKLDYEAYVPMAEAQLARIAGEAEARWPGIRSAVSHRVGTLLPGEAAVCIAVSAPHRKAAFEACQFIIDRLKQDVPIWKKEHFTDGEVWVGLGP